MNYAIQPDVTVVCANCERPWFPEELSDDFADLCVACGELRIHELLAEVEEGAYRVFSGYMLGRVSEFNTFTAALACFKARVADWHLTGGAGGAVFPRLLGEGAEPADGEGSRECDGLTEQQRDLVEAASGPGVKSCASEPIFSADRDQREIASR